MESNNFILLLGIIAVIVAVFNMFVSLDRVGTITGYATDTATVNLTIESLTAINFTIDNLNFGSGQVAYGQANATINTASGTVTGGNWSANNTGLTLENIGNTNVTLAFKAGKTAAEFIGGTNPEYQWNFTNAEAGSCTVVNVTEGSFYPVNTTADLNICNDFVYNNTKDKLRIDFRIVIPSDAVPGAKGDLITATATAI